MIPSMVVGDAVAVGSMHSDIVMMAATNNSQ